MMAIHEKDVLQALTGILDPAQRKSIVELGLVKNIKIGGGNVGFELEMAIPDDALRDSIKSACVQAVKRIKDVQHVSVNITARARKIQAEQRKILTGVKNVIAVASGKGGVGKSTTAVHLAFALASMGRKVGILDADIYGPSIPTMLQIEKPPVPLEGNRIKPAESFGIKLVSMGFFMPKERAAILRGPMVSGYVTQFLANVEWGDLDDLVIDYPPGTGDIQLTLSQQAPITGAVITTTPQEISLVDVRRAIAMFETTRVPVLGVCETMSYFVCDQCDKKHFIFRAGGGERMATHAGVPFLGAIPLDPRLAEGGDSGIPILKSHPDSPAAQAYMDLARGVADQLAILNKERGEYLESFSLEWA